jgi:CHAD domain-containing protein
VYSTKPRILLTPEQRSDQALAAVLRFLLAVVDSTEAGVIEGENLEFLHDFRVACRRSRALVGRIRGVLPRGARRRARAEFAWLSRATCEQRDLDVSLQRLQARLEANTQSALTLRPVLDEWQRRRATARACVARVLRSPRYQRFKRDWRAMLDQAAAGAAGNRRSARPIAAIAARGLARSYRKVRRLGRRLVAEPELRGLHELRKQGKILRYLLEASASLYPVETTRRALKTLEKLQDALGAIVDCTAQLALLRACHRRLGARRVTATAAIDQLIAAEESHRRQLLAEYPVVFRRFDRKSRRRQFKELLRYSHGS